MDRISIVEEFSKDPKYMEYCKKVCTIGDLHKDLYQYVALYLLEMNEEKLIKLHASGGLRMYVARIIYINAYDKTRPFLRQLNGFAFLEIDEWLLNNIPEEVIISDSDALLNTFDEELEAECNKCIQDGIYPAKVKIYQEYEKIGSYKEVSECTHIPYKTILKYVHGTREKILKNLYDKNSNTNN